jgi:hypothetical protein
VDEEILERVEEGLDAVAIGAREHPETLVDALFQRPKKIVVQMWEGR